MRGENSMILLDMSDKRPLYEQVVERFKDLITKGIVEKDEKLPSVRQLAIELSINPNTIQRAYGQLERDGFIYSVKGKGNFVADVQDLIPQRQTLYYERLDELLGQAKNLRLDKTQITEHVKKYFESEEV